MRGQVVTAIDLHQCFGYPPFGHDDRPMFMIGGAYKQPGQLLLVLCPDTTIEIAGGVERIQEPGG